MWSPSHCLLGPAPSDPAASPDSPPPSLPPSLPLTLASTCPALGPTSTLQPPGLCTCFPSTWNCPSPPPHHPALAHGLTFCRFLLNCQFIRGTFPDQDKFKNTPCPPPWAPAPFLSLTCLSFSHALTSTRCPFVRLLSVCSPHVNFRCRGEGFLNYHGITST